MHRKAALFLVSFLLVVSGCADEGPAEATAGGEGRPLTASTVSGTSRVTLAVPDFTKEVTPTLRGYTKAGSDGSPVASAWFTVEGKDWPVVPRQEDGYVELRQAVTLPDGAHRVRLSARSAAGNVTFEEKVMTVDLTPPRVSILAPDSCTPISDNPQVLSCSTLFDNPEVFVRFTVADLRPMTVLTHGVQSTWPSGSHTVEQRVVGLTRGWSSVILRATDALGNQRKVELRVFVRFLSLPYCGDSKLSIGEVCDEGDIVTETACPYGQATCTRCSADCKTVLSLSGAFCGDALTNGSEACDDGNTDTETVCPSGLASCSTCDATCTTALHSLSVRVAGAGVGSIASSPEGINCLAGSCTALFPEGTSLTLKATPAAHSVFTGWSGGCGGTGDCLVAMTQAASVTASFAPPLPPVILGPTQSSTTVPASGGVTFRVGASDPQGSPLSFSWTASLGTLGVPTSGSTTSEVVWTPPVCGLPGTTPSITATVSNALGVSASHSFTVTGLASCASQVVTSLTGGDGYSLSLRKDGSLWAWGYNLYGRLGDGTGTQRNAPVLVSGLSGATAVSAGARHTLALKKDGTVWAWGFNFEGAVGDGTFYHRYSPVPVSNLSGATAVVAGGYHSLALRQDGTVWGWGHPGYGQIGSAVTDGFLPVRVLGLGNIKAIAAGYFHTLALRQDGTVWALGSNDYGQLGDGSTTQRSSPVQVRGLSGITAIAAGGYHGLALRQDGTVWAWGHNQYGQLGGTTSYHLTPVQVQGVSGVTAIAASGSHSLALRQGAVWAWGNNANGQLGDGTITQRNAPTLVPGLSGVTALSAGWSHTLVVRQDGTAWAWGRNANGQLGDGSTTQRNSPVLVPSF